MQQRFVRGCLCILVALTAFGCSAKMSADKRVVVVPLGEIAQDGPVTTIDLTERGVETDAADGIHVVKLKDGSFVALSWRDTHRPDCRAMYQPEVGGSAWVLPDGVTPTFYTACNGSIYDLEGRPLSGPAPRALDQFEVQVKGEDLVIYLEPRS